MNAKTKRIVQLQMKVDKKEKELYQEINKLAEAIKVYYNLYN